MNGDLKPYLERSASTDLPCLLKAKEEAKKRMKDHPTKDNIDAFRKARDEVKLTASEAETPAAGGRLFAKRKDAMAYLKGRGFKLGRTKFYDDCKAALIPTDADGRFEEKVLLAYAANLPTMAREEDTQTADASRQRLEADADHKSEQAKLARMRRLKLEGELVPRAEVERGRAARSQFFRAQVENYGHLMGPQIIALVGGDESKLPQLLRFWEESTADWMDAWAADREFVVGQSDEPAGDAA